MHKISFSPPLSLAMYTELATHLNQVASVNTELHTQTAKDFNYDASQIAAISISYGDETDGNETDQILLRKILDYYGNWQQEVETLNPNLLFQR